MSNENHPLLVHPGVAEALREGAPVVALESTIISHGMPYPHNVATARAVEEEVRRGGAHPATIAIIGGMICVGLSDEQLEFLAACREVSKASRRDIAILVSRGGHGSTTVSATMCCAAMAGISLFVTGGIGGVHRGAAMSFDISADLTELSLTPVAVVCAGAKSILDLPLTLERLETLGVPVIGFGTDEFPSFYSRTSGLPVDCRADTAEEAARIIKTQWDLGLRGGIVIANPIPPEHEIPFGELQDATEKALIEASQGGVKGKQLTPYLLERLHALTGGRSLEANKALILHNAAVGSAVACALSRLRKGDRHGA
ncbi:MAG: pseudouridine-5'-phosphate glycosidase [Candidatus Eremiobacteraeota bacterium]|nr:pseudouridine-5'-phosphate glycosidase [Candidatus Eremiobacteraeota bacterium]